MFLFVYMGLESFINLTPLYWNYKFCLYLLRFVTKNFHLTFHCVGVNCSFYSLSAYIGNLSRPDL
jgi:hypothetical protein